jgi:hypothetical protein
MLLKVLAVDTAVYIGCLASELPGAHKCYYVAIQSISACVQRNTRICNACNKRSVGTKWDLGLHRLEVVTLCISPINKPHGHMWDKDMEMVRLVLPRGAQMRKWTAATTMLDRLAQYLSLVGLQSPVDMVSMKLDRSLVLQRVRRLLKEGLIQHEEACGCK